MNYIQALQNRYSVKKFDKDQKISDEKLGKIIEAARLSASSLGLQPYRLLVIKSIEILQALIPSFYNPSQISTCSHLIAIITRKGIEDEYINNYFHHIAHTREMNLDDLDGFKKSIIAYRKNFSHDEILHWNEKQSYILLGHLLFAAALEKIDSCPMEGFKRNEIAKILNIDTEKEEVSVTLALGIRAEDDPFQKMKKIRKPNDKFLKFL